MWIAMLVIVVVALVIIFLPQLKGWRTQIFNVAVGVIGAAIPILSQWVEFLQGLDWRGYILSADRKNWAIVGVIAGLALVSFILRAKTTGPVGTKE